MVNKVVCVRTLGSLPKGCEELVRPTVNRATDEVEDQVRASPIMMPDELHA